MEPARKHRCFNLVNRDQARSRWPVGVTRPQLGTEAGCTTHLSGILMGSELRLSRLDPLSELVHCGASLSSWLAES